MAFYLTSEFVLLFTVKFTDHHQQDNIFKEQTVKANQRVERIVDRK